MRIVLYFLFLVGLIVSMDVDDILTNVPPQIPFAEGVAVLFLGYKLIQFELKGFGARVRSRFFNAFLASFAISLLYLGLHWVSYMIENYAVEAFDPIRYYYGINTLVRNGETSAWMNYYGVVYFYAFFMRFLGVNPSVPLYVNVLMTLYATLQLTHFFYKPERVRLLRYMPLLMLIPEVICYNALSSREIICMTTLTVAIVKFGIVVKQFNIADCTVGVAALFLLIFVRPPFGFIAMLCMGVYMLFVSKRKVMSAVMCVAMVGVMAFAQKVSGEIGDNEEVAEHQLDMSRTVEESDATEYSNNSVSKMLLPHNSVEFVVFGIIRSFAYVVITPAAVTHPIHSFVTSFGKNNGTGGFCSWTSLFMMLCLPSMYWGVRRYRKLEDREKLILLSAAICFFAVGTFMAAFIHLRYRITYDLLYFAIAFYFLTERKRLKYLSQNAIKTQNI